MIVKGVNDKYSMLKVHQIIMSGVLCYLPRYHFMKDLSTRCPILFLFLFRNLDVVLIMQFQENSALFVELIKLE